MILAEKRQCPVMYKSVIIQQGKLQKAFAEK